MLSGLTSMPARGGEGVSQYEHLFDQEHQAIQGSTPSGMTSQQTGVVTVLGSACLIAYRVGHTSSTQEHGHAETHSTRAHLRPPLRPAARCS